MAEMTIKPRPKNLDLTTIQLPLPGKVSILHRVSGAGMFLCFPLLLWLFSASLTSAESFATFKALFSTLPAKVVLAGLIWAFVHHFCAGIRFLLLDLHKGLELEEARKSSKIVLIVSLTLTLIIGVVLW